MMGEEGGGTVLGGVLLVTLVKLLWTTADDREPRGADDNEPWRADNDKEPLAEYVPVPCAVEEDDPSDNDTNSWSTTED